jgi:hypothetical protein
MTLDEWLEIGITNKWCGPAVCYTHDGLPTSEAEDIEFEEDDPCIHIVRLYESAEQALSIEENHSPSVWRKNG